MSKKKEKAKFYFFSIFLLKILLIFFIVFGLSQFISSKSNSLGLLAVSENGDGEIVSGSLIDLNLEVKPGTGNVYVNLGTLQETDTQLSIINSQRTACLLFELDCNSYDFFYSFHGSALVLKGPSASSAIAILVAKTLRGERINEDIAITGALTSGGIIGNVGGVQEKVDLARNKGFDKVLIPEFTRENITVENISVIRVFDIIDAYNIFEGKGYQLENPSFNLEDYKGEMQGLSETLCLRSRDLRLEVENSEYEENSTQGRLFDAAKKSLNNSQNAIYQSNFYSAGSFCYNANINLRRLYEINKNLSLDEIKEQIEELEEDLNKWEIQVKALYKNKSLKTLNDFYVYLVLEDRLYEAQEVINEAQGKDKSITEVLENINKNSTKTVNLTQERERLLAFFSAAAERTETLGLWKQLLVHSGREVRLSTSKLEFACESILVQATMRRQNLNEYGFVHLDDEFRELEVFSKNKDQLSLCIYRGLELIGQMNTVLGSGGITRNQTQDYTNNLLNLTGSRVSLNSNGAFPLIPQMYFEYAQDLSRSKDYSSSVLYLNYALSYADLNVYLYPQEKGVKSVSRHVILESFDNYIFLISLLVLLGFIGFGYRRSEDKS